MPTEVELQVLKLLTAIELSPAVAQRIEAMGNEAVTVLCEVALGTYPGLRTKVRTNAAGLLGWMTHPQAAETLRLLLDDPDPDVRLHAFRAVATKRDEGAVETLTRVLGSAETSGLMAAEALKALRAIGSARALQAISAYEQASGDTYPHRASAVVRDVLATKRTI